MYNYRVIIEEELTHMTQQNEVEKLTEEEKKKAIELARKMGLIVTFTNDSGIFYTTDGHSRKKLEWKEVFPELKELDE